MTSADRPLDVREDSAQGLRYELRLGDTVSDSDLDDVGTLLACAFKRWPSSSLSVPIPAHLRWKVNGAPGAVGYVQLVRHGRRLVGQHLSAPRTIILNGQHLRAVLGCDSAVGPGFQGIGINAARMAQLREVIDDQNDLGLSFSQNPITIRHDSQYGRQELSNPIRQLFRPLDSRRFAEVLAAREASRVPSWVWRALSLGAQWLPRLRLRRRLRVIGNWQISSIDRFDERFDEFGNAALKPFQVAGARDATFLNWRFADRRAGNFRLRAVQEGERILGFVVTTLFEDRVHIADLLVQPGRDDVLDGLLRDAIQWGREHGAYGVEAWSVAHHPYRAGFSRLGFLCTGRDPGFAYRTPNAELDYTVLANDRAAIHLTKADSDLI